MTLKELARAFYNYKADYTFFHLLPRWKQELYSYQGKPSKTVTLPRVDEEYSKYCLENLTPSRKHRHNIRTSKSLVLKPKSA